MRRNCVDVCWFYYMYRPTYSVGDSDQLHRPRPREVLHHHLQPCLPRGGLELGACRQPTTRHPAAPGCEQTTQRHDPVCGAPRGPTCPNRLPIEARWGSTPLAFAGKLQPRRLIK
jgi:hypothetical protein